jgi:hypothetical protein
MRRLRKKDEKKRGKGNIKPREECKLRLAGGETEKKKR